MASDTVTEEAIVACALEAAIGVLTGSVGVAVVSHLTVLVHLALVEIDAFASSGIVPVTNGASTFSKSAGSAGWAVRVALFCKSADESVSFVAVGALASVGVGISIGNAVRVLVAFSARVRSDFLADTVVAGLVLAAFNVVAWIGRLAFAVDVLEAVWALAHALFVAVSVRVSESDLATSAGNISAWIDVFLA